MLRASSPERRNPEIKRKGASDKERKRGREKATDIEKEVCEREREEN